MTFEDHIRSLKGQWVTIYTQDAVHDEQGNPLAHIGRIGVVESDFLLIQSPTTAIIAIPFRGITSIAARSDGDNLTADLIQAEQSLAKAQKPVEEDVEAVEAKERREP